jgi:hypothetical protein
LAKLSKNCRIPDKKLLKIIGNISEKCERNGEAKLDTDKVLKMFQAPELTGSTEWVTSIGPCSLLLYGCHECGIYPTKSSSWWRCSPNVSVTGQTEQGGYWRCASCCARWSWKSSGVLRLLCIDDEHEGLYFAHIGVALSACEKK